MPISLNTTNCKLSQSFYKMGKKNMERKLKNKYILINVMFTLALALSSVILDLFLKESGFLILQLIILILYFGSVFSCLKYPVVFRRPDTHKICIDDRRIIKRILYFDDFVIWPYRCFFCVSWCSYCCFWRINEIRNC